jgi:hypothetical protein
MDDPTVTALAEARRSALREAGNVEAMALDRGDPTLGLAASAITHAGMLLAGAETLIREAL